VVLYGETRGNALVRHDRAESKAVSSGNVHMLHLYGNVRYDELHGTPSLVREHLMFQSGHVSVEHCTPYTILKFMK
jgi:hypothetical protein